MQSLREGIMETPEKKENDKVRSLVGSIFSWSFADVKNKNLFRNKVHRIPETFLSVDAYHKSFINPLLEETRADLLSNMGTLVHAPSCQILDVRKTADLKASKEFCYNISISRQEKYEPQIGDLFAVTDVTPRCIADLNRPERPYTVALVLHSHAYTYFDDKIELEILSSKPIRIPEESLFAVCLTNLSTNIRIWDALHLPPDHGNLNIIRRVLQKSYSVGDNSSTYSANSEIPAIGSDPRELISNFGLDDSQEEAILSCIASRECRHRNNVKLIWGPPGTGKTKTAASMLFALLKMNCRTLACAPTNIAVVGVAKRLMGLVMPTLKYGSYGLGDILVFGNGERMNIVDHEELFEVFLSYRVSELVTCINPLSGWNYSLEFMISLLEDPKKQYHLPVRTTKKRTGIKDIFKIRRDDLKRRKCITTIMKDIKRNKKKDGVRTETKVVKNEQANKANVVMSIKEFGVKKFRQLSEQLSSCITILYTHLPTSLIPVNCVEQMIRVLDILSNLGQLPDDALANILVQFDEHLGNRNAMSEFFVSVELKKECLGILKILRETFSLPEFNDDHKIRNFCLQKALLTFCTASSAALLQGPVEMVIIDEAAQLKECESCIPLQLPGLCHAVLIGDEKQLPAMVQSKICDNTDFGRSLFERLAKLGHPKLLLKVQYRMHPSISFFPRKQFYDNKVIDGPNVKGVSHDMCFLKGSIFGSYSFIDVSSGKEATNDKGSTKNMVEVFVAAEIVERLHKVSVSTKTKIRVGCISPYNAQVFALQEKLGRRFSTDVCSNFSINVRSVDGFQGSEEDIIIISTVRSNGNGSVGFLSNQQRTNVALTRARHCLWILGSGTTLINSDSIWKKIVLDAKSRGCFHNALEDDNLNQAITDASIQLGQFEALFRTDSPLFRSAKWKVFFSEKFLKSMSRVRINEIGRKVISILQKILNGWRMAQHESSHIHMLKNSSLLMEIYNINANLKLIWTTDILKENSEYMQVIQVWDLIPSPGIPDLARGLDMLYEGYPVDVISQCKDKLIEGNFVFPKAWPADVIVTAKTEPKRRFKRMRSELVCGSLTYR